MKSLLHQLLQASADAHPDRVAVVDRDRSMTYAELEARANQLAHLLRDIGVAPGDRVGIFMRKSIEAVVSIYATLKAGAAYVPLDPKAPTSRVGYIAGNCDIQCLLTGIEQRRGWNDLIGSEGPLENFVVLNASQDKLGEPPAGVQTFTSEAVNAQPDSSVAARRIDLDLAYILYTSGSTGAAKGVMLSHLNALAFVNWAVEEFAVQSTDRLSNHAPHHFDLSVFDLYAAASAGAAVVLVPPETSVFPIELARFIIKNEISVWYSVPSILTMLTEHGDLENGDFSKLRLVLFAGEVFPTKFLSRLMRSLPNVEFANLYGPTETNVCTYYRVAQTPDEAAPPVSIGKAIENVETFVLTEEMVRAKPGQEGELYVRGPTVMLGYWGDPERTARTRIRNPLAGELPDPIYKTGDLIIEQDDGNYHFLGRRDNQIKSRGYRIELGEIEAAIHAHPKIVECAVVAIPDDVFTNRIKAYVVAEDELGREELVRFCADRVPRYMIPEEFEFREALPKGSTGKIDRQTLSKTALAEA